MRNIVRPIRGHERCFFTAANFQPPMSFLGGRSLHLFIQREDLFRGKLLLDDQREFFNTESYIKFGKWKRIDSPTSVFQWRIKWRVKSPRLPNCRKNVDKWKTFCYPRFFGTKLRGKHGELEDKKAIRDVLLLKKFLTNEKTMSKSCTLYSQNSFSSSKRWRRSIMSRPEKFHSKHWGM